MLEGLEGEPEEDDGVEEAVQTMGPEDLQKIRGAKDGGKEERGGAGVGGGRRFQGERERESGRKKKKKA